MNTQKRIQSALADNPIIIFMKGTPDAPQCGFSMRTAEAIKACNVEFSHIDVIAQPDIRATLPQISNWPTFPQVFINGELIGGCDIVLELFQKGELQTIVEAATEKVN